MVNGQWKNQNIKNVKNLCDLIVDKSIHEIIYKHVSGHSGVYGNEMADKLAKSLEFVDEW